MNELKEIRKKMNLSQQEFSSKFKIPLKTLQGWEQGLRKPTNYVIFMIKEIIRLENKNE